MSTDGESSRSGIDLAAAIDDAGTGDGANDSSDARVSGRIEVELTPDELAEAEAIADARLESYRAGRTADTSYSVGSEEAMVRGTVAEYALSICYQEAELDEEIYEQGDDGVDCQLEIDGELVNVDVKASSYEDAWLLVKQGFDHEEADVFVSSYVDEDRGYVEIVGFTWAKELLQDENLEESPSPYSSHQNYTRRGNYEPLPVPNRDDERVDFAR